MSCNRNELVSLLAVGDPSFFGMAKVDQARYVMCKIKEYNDFILKNSISSNAYVLSRGQVMALNEMNNIINSEDFAVGNRSKNDIPNAFNCLNEFYCGTGNPEQIIYNEEVNQIKESVEKLFYLLNTIVNKYTRNIMF